MDLRTARVQQSCCMAFAVHRNRELKACYLRARRIKGKKDTCLMQFLSFHTHQIQKESIHQWEPQQLTNPTLLTDQSKSENHSTQCHLLDMDRGTSGMWYTYCRIVIAKITRFFFQKYGCSFGPTKDNFISLFHWFMTWLRLLWASLNGGCCWE